jgi:Prenyltransferase and squalene oxidase repeat
VAADGEIVGRRALALVAAGAVVGLTPCSIALAAADDAPTPDEAVAAAVTWVSEHQQRDGGFDQTLPGAETPDAVLALAESAQTETEWSTRDAVDRVDAQTTRGGRTPLDAVSRAGTDAPGTLARVLTRVALPLGLDPGEEGPLGDLVARVSRAIHRDDLRFADRVELGAAVLAIGGTLPEGMVDDLLAAQQDDGGWTTEGDPEGEDVDLRTTAAVVDLLVQAGVDPASPALESTLTLVGTTEVDGGWTSDGGHATAAATIAAVQILRALGFDPAGTCWQSHLGIEPGDTSAEAHLVALQREDGSFGTDHPVLTTSEAAHALSGRWLPRGRAADRCGTPRESESFPLSLAVLAVIGVLGVGGGIRVMRGGGQAL